MKNPTKPSTAGVSNRRIGISADPAGVLAVTARSSHGAASKGSATTIANTPAATIAQPMPQIDAIASIAIGAKALPRKPANVWTENDRPSREGSMTEPRMA